MYLFASRTIPKVEQKNESEIVITKIIGVVPILESSHFPKKRPTIIGPATHPDILAKIISESVQ